MSKRKKPVSLHDLPDLRVQDRMISRAINGVPIETGSGELVHRVGANEAAVRFMNEEVALARAGRTAAQAARSDKYDVAIYEAGERIDRTISGVKAYELRALTSLGPALIHTGQVYGGIIEALQATSRTEDFSAGGGRVGPRDIGAYIKPIEMGRLRDLAWEAVPITRVAMAPKRRARKAAGTAELGRPYRAQITAGAMEDKRMVVHARRLIDMVCVQGISLQGVLRAHHWHVNAGNRQRLLKILALCLSDIALIWNGKDAVLGGDWCLTNVI